MDLRNELHIQLVPKGTFLVWQKLVLTIDPTLQIGVPKKNAADRLRNMTRRNWNGHHDQYQT